MLVRSTQAAAAFCFASQFAPLFAAPEKRVFKIGACEWSLRKADPSCMEIAKQIGLDGVQVGMGNASNKMWLRRADVQKNYLDAAKKNGVEISGLAITELNRVGLKSEPRAAIWLNDSVEVARALGVKVILVAQFDRGELKGDKEGVDRTVGVLQEVAPRAEKAGVILGIENYLSAEENLDILQRIGSPAVRVYYDVGNSTKQGYDICKEIRLLGKNICEFHFKDAGFYLGQGQIDFAKVREAIERIGFSGWAQIEAAAPKDLISDYKAHLAFLRTLFPK